MGVFLQDTSPRCPIFERIFNFPASIYLPLIQIFLYELEHSFWSTVTEQTLLSRQVAFSLSDAPPVTSLFFFSSLLREQNPSEKYGILTFLENPSDRFPNDDSPMTT